MGVVRTDPRVWTTSAFAVVLNELVRRTGAASSATPCYNTDTMLMCEITIPPNSICISHGFSIRSRCLEINPFTTLPCIPHTWYVRPSQRNLILVRLAYGCGWMECRLNCNECCGRGKWIMESIRGIWMIPTVAKRRELVEMSSTKMMMVYTARSMETMWAVGLWRVIRLQRSDDSCIYRTLRARMNITFT